MSNTHEGLLAFRERHAAVFILIFDLHILLISMATLLHLEVGWPTAGLQLAYSWPTAGVQLAYSWPTAGLQLAYSWPTAGVQLAYSWRTAGVALSHNVWPPTPFPQEMMCALCGGHSKQGHEHSC